MERFDALSEGPGDVSSERQAFDALWAHLSTFYEAKAGERERLRDEAGIPELESRIQEALDRHCDIGSKICHMQPVTLEGAIVLLREAASTDSPDDDCIDTVARRSALAALERLAEGGRA